MLGTSHGEFKVLLIEEDAFERETVEASLSAVGRFELVVRPDASDALALVASLEPDIVLIGVGSGGMHCSDDIGKVLHELKARPGLATIVLSAREDEGSCVMALNSGADDYIVKPVRFLELVARINAVMRRMTSASANEVLRFDELSIDVTAREVKCSGELVQLTAKEFDLLAYMARSPRRVLTKDQLLLNVWGAEPGWQGISTVKEHVHRLRSKLEHAPNGRRHIVTVHGLGYRFEPSL